MVCGSDGFVDSWAGAITRVTDPATGKKTKVEHAPPRLQRVVRQAALL